jgi:nucleoside-diphosphate-sugar epimerase
MITGKWGLQVKKIMKILISGSAGIIGRQLLLQILKHYPGAAITVINRNASDHIYNKRITNIKLDLLTIDENKAITLFNEIKPDLFFHLAWNTSHKDYLTTHDNIKWEQVSIALIKSFYSSGGKKFIGIGSSIEYDWKSGSRFDASTSLLNGNGWLYGQCKLNVYEYLKSLPDISYLWCRVFFVFGPGQSETRLIPLVIKNALYSDGNLTINRELKRDYISTFEIARQIIMMQETDYSGAVNICSGRVTKLGDIIRVIENYTNKCVTLSDVQYQGSFENESIGGNIDLINRYYPDYSYSFEDFEVDLRKTIEDINN